jgi:hypothetical protein
MDRDSIRTIIDLPRTLHQRLHEAATRRGCSASQLILRGVERVIGEYSPQPPERRLTLENPIVRSTGNPVRLTNEQIYGGMEFP